MSEQAGLSSGAAMAAGVAAIAVAIGLTLYFGGVLTPSAPEQADPVATTQSGEGSTATATDTVTVAMPEANPVEDTTDTGATEIMKEAVAMPAPPTIDTFRLEPDGRMLVAGKTNPNWQTSVLVDGVGLEVVKPDSSGQFVTFLNLEQSDQPRILSVRMDEPDGDLQVASEQEVIIAPTPVSQPEAAEIAEGEATQATEGETSPEVAKDETPDAITADTGENVAAAEVEVVKDETPSQDDTATVRAEKSSQTVLMSDASGVRVLQPAIPADAAPEVMSTVALDAITYSDAGEVQLSGRGQGAGFVRVYLDNAPVTTSRIEGDGNWRTDLPEVDTGVYTLRIDEVDAQGNVTSRVETPFKREDEEVISASDVAADTQRVKAVTVQPGSTLWAISRETYGDGVMYVRVFEANRDRIRNPDLIYPGQVFTLPE